MKNLNLTYIITALILTSGIVGYGLINYNQAKLVAQEQQAKKVVKVITPTLQPTVSPTPTVIYKTTTQAQTQTTMSADDIGKELKAMYPAQYGKYSDEELGELYIAKYGNTPISQHIQLHPLVQVNTNCSTNGNYTNCTSTSQ